MKRLVTLLLCLLMTALPRCTSAEGWIAEAVLSDEEDALLELLMMDEEWGPYDFKAPEGATRITLTLLEMKAGQWSERLTATRMLAAPSNATELTITATLNEHGNWDAHVHQNESRPDGRIYIDAEDAPNRIGLNIQQPRVNDYSLRIAYWYSSYEDYVNTFGMSCYQRTFHQPEKDGRLQQQIIVPLNDPVPIEFYGCFFDGNPNMPALSEFNTPEAFAEFDYAFAVTVTFSADPLPKEE